MLRRCALVLVVFAVLAVFWSPQWILWFLPLTVPLATRYPVKAAVVTLDAVNYLSFFPPNRDAVQGQTMQGGR